VSGPAAGAPHPDAPRAAAQAAAASSFGPPAAGPRAVRVLGGEEARAADRATIDAGTPSRALMQRAGAAAAAEIALRYADRLDAGVAVHAGPGNNGGDGWVVAGALARAGVPARVRAWGGEVPRTDDARYERARALATGATEGPTGAERVVVDAVLGVGASGAPRGWAAEAVRAVVRSREGGAVVVALDVPSGLDASTGAAAGDAVRAHLTLTFGACKRGLLVARDVAGAVVVLDVDFDLPADAPTLVAAPAPRPFTASAHKGTRGRLLVVGGAPGMAGAALLAGRAALRSGAGLVRLAVAPESVATVQGGLPAAIATAWPDDDVALAALVERTDAVLLGPGLGADARGRCERVLRAWRGPVVVDADALNAFAGDADALGALLRGRPAVLTPHPLECARLIGATVTEVLDGRFEIPHALAAALGATVLLKGTPTVIADGEGTLVVATGAPALATGGSGDVLGGIVATLLAQDDGRAAALAAEGAWVHDRAGVLAAGRRGGARGTTLDDVLDALGEAWPRARIAGRPPVLAELPAVVG
jgi:NAD(P)H-hydrate epimerase